MSIPAAGRVLGLDWGTRRIGAALSDDTQLIAAPLETLTRRTGRRLPLKQLLTLIETHGPVGVVVGLPLRNDGMEGEAATGAREMGRVVEAKSGLPVEWIDESFTTTDALRARRDAGGRPDRHDVDARAAAMLLQRWLDQRRPARDG